MYSGMHVHKHCTDMTHRGHTAGTGALSACFLVGNVWSILGKGNPDIYQRQRKNRLSNLAMTANSLANTGDWTWDVMVKSKCFHLSKTVNLARVLYQIYLKSRKSQPLSLGMINWITEGSSSSNAFAWHGALQGRPPLLSIWQASAWRVRYLEWFV